MYIHINLDSTPLYEVNNFETVYNVTFDGPRRVALRVNNAFAAKSRPITLPEAIFEAHPASQPAPMAPVGNGGSEHGTSV